MENNIMNKLQSLPREIHSRSEGMSRTSIKNKSNEFWGVEDLD